MFSQADASITTLVVHSSPRLHKQAQFLQLSFRPCLAETHPPSIPNNSSGKRLPFAPWHDHQDLRLGWFRPYDPVAEHVTEIQVSVPVPAGSCSVQNGPAPLGHLLAGQCIEMVWEAVEYKVRTKALSSLLLNIPVSFVERSL